MSVTAEPLASVTVRSAIPAAIRDLLEHPLPLVLTNVVWGALALVAWLAAAVSPPLALAIVVLMTWPAATVATVAARVVRGQPVSIRDALRWPVRRPAIATLGAIVTLVVVIGLVDIQAAMARDDLLGVAFATLTGWGLIALGILACVIWPLLGDPARAHLTMGALVRLAVTLIFLWTPRIIALGVVVGMLLVVSAVLAAALLSVSLSLAALVLSRVILPLADGLDRALE